MKSIYSMALLAGIVGCARSNDAERYVPPEEVARQALDAALSAWQAGRPAGAVPDQSPKVQFMDSMRKPGQGLAGYEILGEIPSDGRRGFLVQLRLKDPSETSKVRFCVIGIDPLWVFREEELDMLAHWTCGASEDEAKTKETEPQATQGQTAIDHHKGEAEKKN